MNERRRFLKVISGATVALAAACKGSSAAGTGGDGAGGEESSTDASSGTTGSSGSSSSASTGTSASSSASSSSGSTCENDPPGTKLGKPSSYADGLTIEAGDKVLIGRDSGGLYCLTSICTHQHCDMAANGDPGILLDDNQEIKCICHGSVYNATGGVVTAIVKGQAPLQAWALALGCDGFIYADVGTAVASTVRLKA